MSSAELKRIADQLSPEERLFLAAYLKHLARRDDPAYQAELTRLNREIDRGKKYSLEQVKRINERLKKRES